MGQNESKPEINTEPRQPQSEGVFSDVRKDLIEYAAKVPHIHSFNDWVALNKNFLDEPFAGLDKFATGAIFGVCSGYSARRAFQLGAVLVGAGFVSLQFLQYFGYVNVDWKKVQSNMEATLDLNKDGKLDRQDLDIARKKLMRVLTWGLPCAGGFGTGFILGLRGKF